MESLALEGEGWIEVDLRITGRIRIVSPGASPNTKATSVDVSAGKDGLIKPVGLLWTEELHPAADFTQRWPTVAGSKPNLEEYREVVAAKVTLKGNTFIARIGRAERHQRGRLTVFFDRQPIAEFVEMTDGKRFASVIKPNGKKVLQPGDTPPPLYAHANLANYRDATGMSGIGVPNAMAVVIDESDHRSAIHHAAARWLGRHGYPIEPADE